MLTRKPTVCARAISMLTATTVFTIASPMIAWPNGIRSFYEAKPSTLAGSVTNDSANATHQRKKPGGFALGEADCLHLACSKTPAGSFPVNPSSCALVRPTTPISGLGRSAGTRAAPTRAERRGPRTATNCRGPTTTRAPAARRAPSEGHPPTATMGEGARARACGYLSSPWCTRRHDTRPPPPDPNPRPTSQSAWLE
jgi:hypothetical protein